VLGAFREKESDEGRTDEAGAADDEQPLGRH
jgi:hypothetical protein